MKIIINGQPLESDKIHGENLEEILSDIQKKHITGSIVGEVLVNGKSYQEDVPHAALEFSHEDIQTLELTTRSVEEIAWHFIENGEHIVNALTNALPKIVEMFRLGDETEANEHYLHFLEALQLLLNMLNYTRQTLDIDFNHEYDGQNSIEAKMERLSEVMSELIRIQEENDWIYLADILEYDLTKELIDFKTILPRLKTKLH
ncbi:MAG: hypothetical protein JRF41_03965 [Deltaproteobacteria bacterium]|nr:hypothetical protein [Deltaproteobacteria bacterium]MBW2322666.1 hypothetical protein [Deltaproteobacteria bacterium]